MIIETNANGILDILGSYKFKAVIDDLNGNIAVRTLSPYPPATCRQLNSPLI